jgi:multiple sugar transport system substrate-binding protein
VSNFLNGTCPVSLAKQKRIIEAIEKLNYMPNLSAKTLKSQSAKEIGVVLPDLFNPYFARVLQGIEMVAATNNYTVSLVLTGNEREAEIAGVKRLLRKQVAGLIVSTCQPDNYPFFYRNIAKVRIPLVLLDNPVQSLIANCVRFDDEDTIATLTERAVAQGHSRIALVASMFCYGNSGHAPPCFSKVLEAHGLQAENDFIALNIDTKSSAFSTTLLMLKRGVPDAVVTNAAHFAEGIAEALHCNGYRVPEDVGLYTFDEENWSLMEKEDGVVRLYRRPITLGNTAANLLLENIISPLTFEPRTIRLPTVPSVPVVVQPLRNSVREVAPGPAIRAVLLTPSYSKEVASLLPNFANKTGISVDLSLCPHAEYIDYVNSELIKNDPPDVFLVDIPWIQSYVEEGLIEELTPYMPPIEELRDLYLPNCFDNLGEIGGACYGLPFIYVPQIVYYRKDLFTDIALRNAYERKVSNRLCAPRTWTEFNVIADFFTRKSNPNSPTEYGVSIPAAFFGSMAPEIRVRLYAYGSEVYDKNYKVVFQSEATLKAYIHLANMLKSCPPDCFSKTRDDMVADFLGGSAAMMVTYQPITQLARRCGMGGWSMCVSAKSKNKEAAARFVLWACGKEIAEYYAVMSDQTAVERIFENDELRARNRWYMRYDEICKSARPTLSIHCEGKKTIPNIAVDRVLFDTFLYIAKDGMSVPDAVRRGHEDFVALFEAYGYEQ